MRTVRPRAVFQVIPAAYRTRSPSSPDKAKPATGGAIAGSLGTVWTSGGARRNRDEPGHAIPVDFQKHGLAGLLGFAELAYGLGRAVDRVTADLLDHVAGLQALRFRRAAGLDLGDQRTLDRAVETQLLPGVAGQWRQRDAVGARALGVRRFRVRLDDVRLGLVAHLGGDRHVLAVAPQAELDRVAGLHRGDHPGELLGRVDVLAIDRADNLAP